MLFINNILYLSFDNILMIFFFIFSNLLTILESSFGILEFDGSSQSPVIEYFRRHEEGLYSLVV